MKAVSYNPRNGGTQKGLVPEDPDFFGSSTLNRIPAGLHPDAPWGWWWWEGGHPMQAATRAMCPLAATVGLDLGWAQVWQKTGEHRA